MINANAMDAKGITNDLPLSLSISTESIYTVLNHTGVLIHWKTIPFATLPLSFILICCVCSDAFLISPAAAVQEAISGTADGFILGKLREARKRRKVLQ